MNQKMLIRLTNYVLILIVFCLSHIRCSDGTGVPVLMWRSHTEKSNPIIWSQKSSITRIDFDVLKDDYLKDSQTIIAFLQNDLSIEQFSIEDKSRFKTLNHIINDQTLEPTLLTDVLEPNKALKDFSIQEIKNLNINNGNKIVINLPEKSLVENDELIGQLLDKINQNVTTKTLYLVTGRHNSQYKEQNEINDGIVVNHRFRRHILADNLEKRKVTKHFSNKNNDDIKRLININDCLFFFMRKLSVRNPNGTLITYFDSLKNGANTENSKCWKNNEEPAILDLTYNNSKYSLRIQFMITNNQTNGFWGLKAGKATYIDDKSQPIGYNLDVDHINSENRFSYSCSKLIIETKEKDKSSASVFDNFQLQPFENPSNKKGNKGYIFVDSFDCQQWMTLGLWMGLITLLLFGTILLIGVYSLWLVSSPDTFENPKGKPLIITNTDE